MVMGMPSKWDYIASVAMVAIGFVVCGLGFMPNMMGFTIIGTVLVLFGMMPLVQLIDKKVK